ncbi:MULTISPECIES: LuxR C-terminal-related transcriptional regulator [Shewanella]|uniref:Transcriptional regulator, LuxR family n=3 Tax=Shewanella putrefaciens TaxID=24 RepID=E6XPQ0_SHEP2|nr:MULTISPECIES: LuxR C-terminal-related transcriptional regulator [Shewanella]CAD6367081.1 HTH-type transcriptional regulator MalT [Shewanella hafniensis]AVV86272.1 LuxR family transcriptional regulator [Shewanella putrefaciens]MCK7631785.1 LuxR C-terminal-related transcriptional regulator [Shewanella sp. JNE9-1]MCK7646982.1 LuxR C-terminal-related transcriptional regulator [Shewanella sp. JNE3-1]MCK7655045.1 LuxR C-terminal-related transcriptional regulator [Shewanella sp. JNE4-1]
MFKILHWIVVSRSQILVELLAGRWPQEFLVKLSPINPDVMLEHIKDNQASMVVIDLATVDLQKAYQFQRSLAREHPSVRVVYIQFPKQVDARFLTQSATTAGVFYLDAGIAEISLGLSNILRGHRVIPMQLINGVNDDFGLFEDTEPLTIREREVLQALLSGSTNLDIANQLFVSESTIKTHLYRVFRKIGVSSRGQAIAWAQTYLHDVVV